MIRAIAAALALLAVTGSVAVQVTQSGRGAYEASLAPSKDGFAVAWYDARHGHAEIYARLLDANGRPASREWRLTEGPNSAYEPDLQGVGGSLAIAWYEQAPATRKQIAKLGTWSRSGRSLWTTTLSADGRNGRNPVVRVAGDRLFCAWLESSGEQAPDVWAVWLNRQGRQLVPPRRIAPAGPTTWNLNAAVDAGGVAWLVFDAQADTRADELFLARIDQTDSRVVRLSADDGFASKYPDLALSERGAALTWFDERDGNQEIYLAVVPIDALDDGVEALARRVTNTPGESIGAYVAWNGARIGLVWCDNTPGQDEVYFQRFDAAGAPLADAVQLTHNATQSLIPAIRPWRDTFALVWNEFAPGTQGPHGSDGRSEVFFRLF